MSQHYYDYALSPYALICALLSYRSVDGQLLVADACATLCCQSSGFAVSASEFKAQGSQGFLGGPYLGAPSL